NVVRGLKLWRSPDGVDVLWLATEGGVARAIAGSTPWQTASLIGASGIGVFGVTIDTDPPGNERLWVAASPQGLALYADHRWRDFLVSNSTLASDAVRMIKHAIDERGNDALWVGLGNGALQRAREGPTFENVVVPWPPSPGQAVTDVLGRNFDGE